MSKLVIGGAQIKCSMGNAPSNLVVAAAKQTNGENQGVATVQDHVPNKNIMAFGQCRSLANPQVAAATVAANGKLTPQPCVPVTPSPWAPGSPSVFVARQAALVTEAKCQCQWAGIIEVVNPLTQKTEVA